MDLLQKTLQICQEHNIKPVRSKGQNFLIAEDVYERIIDISELKKRDIILEVGPGLGFLTERLAEKVDKVIAVELDDKLANILKEKIAKKKIKNVEVVNKNILDFDLSSKLAGKSYKIVANLPYNISSIFLRRFLERVDKPELLVLMLQKEVAERIVACPPKMSILAVAVQYFAEAEIAEYIGRKNFWPSPEVDSAIIRISDIRCQISDVDEKDFFRLVKIGFSSKRKMLKNNLATGYHIGQDKALQKIKLIGLNEKIRAEGLSVEDWRRLLEEV
ncbi:MAG: 16S rRNA (adenine(1518)-N(6)/adenine(1519)-N(6))-dimethyltransferase RsmA [bacterium]